MLDIVVVGLLLAGLTFSIKGYPTSLYLPHQILPCPLCAEKTNHPLKTKPLPHLTGVGVSGCLILAKIQQIKRLKLLNMHTSVHSCRLQRSTPLRHNELLSHTTQTEAPDISDTSGTTLETPTTALRFPGSRTAPSKIVFASWIGQATTGKKILCVCTLARVAFWSYPSITDIESGR